MRQERLVRGSDESSEFDWQRTARELEVPLDVARTLYLRATRIADEPHRAEVLYLRWLRDATATRQPTSPPVPGRRTRVEHEARAPRRPWPENVPAVGLGKWTRALLETEVDDAAPDGQERHRAITVGRDPAAGSLVRTRDIAARHAPPAQAVMRKTDGGAVDANAAALIEKARSGGAPLADDVRAPLEASLGADLGGVRVHDSGEADAAARALGAVAFAVGQDLFFQRGAYDPSSHEGRRLLAHEVAHTVQTSTAQPAANASGLRVSDPHDAAEREADDFAEAFVQRPGIDVLFGRPATRLDHARVPAVHTAAGASVVARTPAGSTTPTGSATPAGSKANAMSKVAPTAPPSPQVTKTTPPTVQMPPPPPAAGNAHAPAATRPATPAQPAHPAAQAQPAAPAPRAPTAAPSAPTAATSAPTAATAPAAAGMTIAPTGNFAAQIQQAVAAHKTAIQQKAAQTKTELAASIATEKQRLAQGFTDMLAKITADRDKALADLATRADAAKSRVRDAATQEHTKLDAALAQHQQAVRTTGETIATQAITQATAQGDRAVLGAQQRAASALSVGEKWAGQFSTIEGGASTATDVRAKASQLAGKLTDGAAGARQTCIDHGTRFATDVRKDAADVAAGMPDKLTESRQKIDKDRDDTLKSIDDGHQGAHDGITRSFESSKGEITSKQSGAGDQYTQLASGLTQNIDTGTQQLLAKIDPMAQALAQHAQQAETEGAKYAVAPEVTQTVNQRIAAVVQDQLGKIADVGGKAQTALGSASTEGKQAAAQQTQQVLDQLQTTATGLSTNIQGKATGSAAKFDESAQTSVTGIATVTPSATQAMSKAVAKGQTDWTGQLTTNVSKLSGGIDDILGQQDSEVAKLDTDLGNEFKDAQDKVKKSHEDQGFWSGVWDSVTSFVGDVFSFAWGTIVGFFQAAVELVVGLWNMVQTLWGALILLLVIILAVLVVVLFGWEVLLIIGLVIAIVAAIYYIYLMITTPGLSWYERGKLFGHALFNLALGLSGFVADWGELLNVAKWVPQAVELVEAMGGLGRAIELYRAAGGFAKALELIRLLGGADELIELAEAVGGISNLVQLVKAAGGAAELLRVIEAAGGIQELMELINGLGGIDKMLKLAKAVGGLARLTELVQEAGGVTPFTELVAKAGSIQTLIEILGNAKIANNVRLVQQLLALPKVGDGATLLKLLEEAKITDVAMLRRLLSIPKITSAEELLTLLANAKVTSVAKLEELLNSPAIPDVATLTRLLATKVDNVEQLAELVQMIGGKVQNLAQLEQLLNSTKLADGAELLKLLQHAKVADGAQLLKLLDNIDSAVRLLRMLDIATMPSGAKLLEFLEKAGGASNAGLLEDLLKLARSGNVLDAQQLLDRAAGNVANFRTYATWATRLAARTPGPAYAAPPQVAAHGFTIQANNLLHFLDHTWEFCRLGTRANKPMTTFWPPGTPPSHIADELGRALDGLNPAGGHAHPVPGAGGEPWGSVHVGTVNAVGGPRIGMFYPTVGETIMPDIMRALIALLGP